MDSLTEKPQLEPSRPGGVRRLAQGLSSALAVAAVVAVVTIAAMLAVVFAATLALVMLLASLLMALAALAWRVRPRPVQAAAPPRGHAWITYSWTGPGR